MAAGDVDRASAVLAQRTQARELITRQLEARVLPLVGDMSEGDWYRHDVITDLTSKIVRVVETGQTTMSRLTDAYLSEVTFAAFRRRAAATATVDPSTLRKGVTHQGVYGRMADEYRRLRSEDKPRDEAMRRVTGRARTLIGDDLGLAIRHQGMRWMRDNKVSAYRRIVRPEMSGGACGLCIAAADRIYHRGDLMPVHTGCKCDVMPIIGDLDPGKFLNDADLEQIYANAGGSKRAEDLVKTQYDIVEHGELGPTLVDARYHFRGPREVAAAGR